MPAAPRVGCSLLALLAFFWTRAWIRGANCPSAIRRQSIAMTLWFPQAIAGPGSLSENSKGCFGASLGVGRRWLGPCCCRDAWASPPWPPPKSTAAIPHSIFRQVLIGPFRVALAPFDRLLPTNLTNDTNGEEAKVVFFRAIRAIRGQPILPHRCPGQDSLFPFFCRAFPPFVRVALPLLPKA